GRLRRGGVAHRRPGAEGQLPRPRVRAGHLGTAAGRRERLAARRLAEPEGRRLVKVKAAMQLGLATDHGGFGLKQELLARLRAAGHEVVDFGAHELVPDDDYPDFIIPLARAVAAGTIQRGVAVCGSGVGASICANKVAGVRAALITELYS